MQFFSLPDTVCNTWVSADTQVLMSLESDRPILDIGLSDSSDINFFFAPLKTVVVTCVMLSRANSANWEVAGSCF